MLKCGSVHGKIWIEYNGEILAKLQEAPSLNLVVWSKGRLPFRMVTGVLLKFGSSRSGLNSGICRVKEYHSPRGDDERM